MKNKIKNIIKSKKGIDKFSVYFSMVIICISIIAVVLGFYMVISGNTISDIEYAIVSFFEEDFYSKKFEDVNADYLRDSDGFNFDLSQEIGREDFKGINITKYMKENLDWEKVYPYFYRYIERQEENVIFRNQGLYIQIDGEYRLISYLTPTVIYFDIHNMGEAKTKDLMNGVELLCNTLCASEVYKDINGDHIFMEDLIYLDAVFEPVFLQVNFEKPVIYLYPETKTDISVTVDGVDLTTTYPEYNNGWTVTAYPDGTLIDNDGREYNYLYWEGKSYNFESDLSEGFVVFKENYIEFLEEKLDYIGLTNKESADFISYWLPQMNEFDYCLVSFQMKNYEEHVNLDFSVRPDNELRVFVVFKGLSNFVQIEEQDLSYYNSFERKGFTVVEWGGTFIN